MGIMKDAFGWMFGLKECPVDKINVEDLERKLIATRQLRTTWERELKTDEQLYLDTTSVEVNAKRTPIERSIERKRANVILARVKTIKSAICMIDRIAGSVEKLKMLKTFYLQQKDVMQLPGNLTMAELQKAVYELGGAIEIQSNTADDFGKIIDDVKIGDLSPEDVEERELNEKLEKLYEEYDNKIASNDTAGAQNVKSQIEALTNAQIGLV